MKNKIKSIIKLFSTEIKADEREKYKYISLLFIKDDFEKCTKIIQEILFGKFWTYLDCKIKLLIYIFYNVSKDIKLDGKSKFNYYIEVSNEAYREANQIIDTSSQSRLLAKGLQTEIYKTFEDADTNQKSAQELVSNINLVQHLFQEKLDQYQKLYNERLEEEKKIETEAKEQMIKQISFKDSQFYSKELMMSRTEFLRKFAKSYRVYKKLGQFQYRHQDFTPGPIQKTMFETMNGNYAIYLGQLTEGTCILEGIGIVVSSDGHIYEGYWKNNQKEGNGRHISDDGYYYIGDFKDGNRHGYGIGYHADGDRYEGEWRNDMLHGQGLYYYANGSTHEGDFRDNCRTGQGIYYSIDGGKYIGEWKDGNLDGQGTYYYSNYSKYTGQWKNSQYNGFGTKYKYGAGSISGNWLNGRYVSP